MAFGEGAVVTHMQSQHGVFRCALVAKLIFERPMPRRIAIPGKRQQKLNYVLSNLTRGNVILLVDYESYMCRGYSILGLCRLNA